jgi:hypothetical protein
VAGIVTLRRRIDRATSSNGSPVEALSIRATPLGEAPADGDPAGPRGEPPGSALAGGVHAVPAAAEDAGTAPAAAGITRLIRGAGLTGLVRSASAQADEAGPGSDRILPVLPELRCLLPSGGLRRGSTVAVTPGATSVLLALLAAASAAGSWCAVVGLPTLGALAAADLGIALDRLALVPAPGPDWPNVVAALLDGVDVVVAAPAGPVAASIAGRLAARARQRGSVLLPYARWAGADVVLEATGGGWQGLGQGRGRLHQRELVIHARGRGAAARPREVTVWLPDHTGALAPSHRTSVTGRPERPAVALLEAAS